MSVGFDPGTDFEDIVDGLQAVTLDRRGSSQNVAVTAALCRNVSTSEIVASDGKLQSGDTRWHLPAAEVTTAPRLGDSVEDSSGNRYQILEVRDDTLNNRWRCTTRNLRIAYGLDDTLTIEKAAYSKGTAGAAERSWSTWRTGVRARIQTTSAEHAEQARARRTLTADTVLLEDDYDLTDAHRLKDLEGNYYRILGVTSKGEIGRPMVIEARPWR